MHLRIVVTIATCFLSLPTYAQSPLDFEGEPINYQTAAPANAISRLNKTLGSGETHLKYHPVRGYLDAVLEQLNISTTTQALVYSKTSLQLRPISARNPRALYFNDEVYIGWVPTGDVLEIIASDPNLGTVFYTLSQRKTETPAFVKDRGQCLQCHANRRTKEVPGPLVRSFFTSYSGQPAYNFGSHLSDHTSPLKERWGGYYVTGSHGKMLHMGNLFVYPNDPEEDISLKSGANITTLPRSVKDQVYPVRHSDIVALMVLEHQTQMQNLITKVIYEERRGVHYDKAFDLDEQGPSGFTQRRIQRATEALVEYMFFAGEFKLTSPIKGTSGFSKQFSTRTPASREGNSLYQLNLKTRMFDFPLSYMIYSQAFSAIGPMSMTRIQARVAEILSETHTESDARTFHHLTPELRKSIKEILIETHPALKAQLMSAAEGTRD